MTAHNYSPSVNKLLTFGDPTDFYESNGEWTNYLDLGFGPDDIPELIRLIGDDSLRSEDATEEEYCAHIHAWRILGQLKAVEAAESLVQLFALTVESDWVIEDLPIAFGLIGPTAIPTLKNYMAAHADDETMGPETVLDALRSIVEHYPEVRDDCIIIVVEQLTKFEQNTDTLNSLIITELVHFKVVEAAPLIKSAHAAHRVDLAMNGTWQHVRNDLGLDPSVEIPGPEPEEESLSDYLEKIRAGSYLFNATGPIDETDQDFYINEPDPDYVRPPKKQTKAKAQQKAKRKQEKQSRKRNRKK